GTAARPAHSPADPPRAADAVSAAAAAGRALEGGVLGRARLGHHHRAKTGRQRVREKLRFDNLPPAGVILPFLLVAPLFALAGLLALLAGGLEGALARWHPHTIAAVHLFTLGYLLPVMIAALMQMLPVLTGRHLRAGTATGFLLQVLLFAGAAAFAAGLGGISAGWSRVAFLALLAGLLLFGYRIGTGVIPTLRERGAGREMLLAVGGLVVTAALGLRLLAAWAWPDISLPR